MFEQHYIFFGRQNLEECDIQKLCTRIRVRDLDGIKSDEVRTNIINLVTKLFTWRYHKKEQDKYIFVWELLTITDAQFVILSFDDELVALREVIKNHSGITKPHKAYIYDGETLELLKTISGIKH